MTFERAEVSRTAWKATKLGDKTRDLRSSGTAESKEEQDICHRGTIAIKHFEPPGLWISEHVESGAQWERRFL